MKTTEIQKLLERPICFFDLETTGVNPLTDRIVQISVIKIHPDGKTETKTKYVNPQIPIPEGATEIHGITDEKVKGAPTFLQLAKGIKAFISGSHFGGYNSNRFDVPLLAKEFERCGIKNPFTGAQFVDVFNIYKEFNRRQLKDCYLHYLGKEMKGGHDAENDVTATIEIFEEMLCKYNDKDVPKDLRLISGIGLKNKPFDLFNKIVITPEGKHIFNFGKFNGKGVREIYEIEKRGGNDNYFDWVFNKSDLPQDTKDKIKFIINSAK